MHGGTSQLGRVVHVTQTHHVCCALLLEEEEEGKCVYSHHGSMLDRSLRGA